MCVVHLYLGVYFYVLSIFTTAIEELSIPSKLFRLFISNIIIFMNIWSVYNYPLIISATGCTLSNSEDHNLYSIGYNDAVDSNLELDIICTSLSVPYRSKKVWAAYYIVLSISVEFFKVVNFLKIFSCLFNNFLHSFSVQHSCDLILWASLTVVSIFLIALYFLFLYMELNLPDVF